MRENDKILNAFQGAMSAYASGDNVTEYLKRELGERSNDARIIEMAYDLQAGTYIQLMEKSEDQYRVYHEAMASMISEHTLPADRWLDAGCGELTFQLNASRSNLINVDSWCGFDASWSRLKAGLDNMKEHASAVEPFITCSSIDEIPFNDGAFAVVTTMHALEPNGGKELKLLRELIRVTGRTLLLFEPSYDSNSPEGQRRMRRHGYISELEPFIKLAGGVLVAKNPVESLNPLNPTYCYVVKPKRPIEAEECFMTAPGSGRKLSKLEGAWFDEYAGVCYPELLGVPIIKSGHEITATRAVQYRRDRK